MMDSCQDDAFIPINTKLKMNGISLWMDEFKPQQQDLNFIPLVNADWVALVPYCYVSSDTSGIDYDRQNYWYGFELEGLKTYIKYAKQMGLKVFVKPHIWVEYGPPSLWHGNLNFPTEDDWVKFETTYFDYIQDIIHIADSMDADAFALGVELRSFVAQRPQYWNMMIDSARKLYDGTLTYCANWDDYFNVPFWNKLDFIGIDSYFTISDQLTPSITECKNNLEPIKEVLENFSEQHGKPIAFTEYGFQSRDYAGYDPWNRNYNNTENTIAQANCYQAVFETFWHEEWFAGGFSWLWYWDQRTLNGLTPIDYSPQNKQAQATISNFFLQANSN